MAYDYQVQYLETGLYPLVSGVISCLVALLFVWNVFRAPKGNKEMNEIATAIQEGARAFLRVEYSYLVVFMCAIFILIAAAIDWRTGICYLVGVFSSAGCGYLGMWISTHANVRTAAAAEKGLNAALRVAFSSGAVMGLSVVGVALTGLSALYLIFDDKAFSTDGYLPGYGMGATSVSLFTRVGGGIYTKAADVGADLVGKLEADIPEDDARNPATIADNVGDNVGDVAGMGADIFGSFAGSIIACCLLAVPQGLGQAGIALPFWIAASGVLASIAGIMAVRTKEGATQFQVLSAVRNGVFLAMVLQCGFMAAIVAILRVSWKLYGAIVIGLACGRLVGLNSEYFTSFAYKPTKSIAKAGLTGPASVVIQGLAVGMVSTIGPGLIVASTVLASVALAGFYGIALASVGLLSNLGVTLATDAFGPVADNAGGIAEMAQMPPHVRQNTDVLDALGNTTAAVGKGFAMGSAVLTGLGLLSSYATRVQITGIDVLANQGYTMAGLLMGAMLPFAFGAVTMGAVAKAARGVVVEVRRQFREIPGIMERTARPEYAKCVELVTRSSLISMVLPGVIVVMPPIIVGIGLGPYFLGGMLASSIVCSFVLGLMMSAAGGAWDNAKKYVETGVYGGKKSDAHKATVVGDTIGDPFKDTSGPSLNILVKLSTYAGVVLAKIYKKSDDIWWVALILLGLLLVFVPFWLNYMAKSSKRLGVSSSAPAAPTAVEMTKPQPAAVAARAPATDEEPHSGVSVEIV